MSYVRPVSVLLSLALLTVAGCSSSSSSEVSGPPAPSDPLPALQAVTDGVEPGRIVDSAGREVLLRGVNVNAIAPHLAEGFHVGRVGKSEFLERVEQQLTRYRVDDPSLRHFETVFPGDGGAEVVFDATCAVRSADEFVNRLPSRWRVRMVEEGGRWRVVEVEVLPAPLSPLRDLHDWLP